MRAFCAGLIPSVKIGIGNFVFLKDESIRKPFALLRESNFRKSEKSKIACIWIHWDIRTHHIFTKQQVETLPSGCQVKIKSLYRSLRLKYQLIRFLRHNTGSPQIPNISFLLLYLHVQTSLSQELQI